MTIDQMKKILQSEFDTLNRMNEQHRTEFKEGAICSLRYAIGLVDSIHKSKADLKAPTEYNFEPFKVIVDTVTGSMCEWREGEKLNARSRVIAILASEPVGMGQPEPQTPDTQQAEGSQGRGYLDRCVLVSTDTPEALHDRHEAWTAGVKQGKAEAAAPEPDAHKYPKAVATLESLIQGFAKDFVSHSQVEGSVLKGDYWVIFADGALEPLSNWVYTNYGSDDQIPVYYAERN